MAGTAPALNRHCEGWPRSGLEKTLCLLVGPAEQTEPWPRATEPPAESRGQGWQDTSQNGVWNLKTQGQGYGCDCYPARSSVCIYAKALWYLEARDRLLIHPPKRGLWCHRNLRSRRGEKEAAYYPAGSVYASSRLQPSHSDSVNRHHCSHFPDETMKGSRSPTNKARARFQIHVCLAPEPKVSPLHSVPHPRKTPRRNTGHSTPSAQGPPAYGRLWQHCCSRFRTALEAGTIWMLIKNHNHASTQTHAHT